MLGDNLTTFFGRPVRDFDGDGAGWDFAGTAPRFRQEYEAEVDVVELLGAYAALPGAVATEAIVVGAWESGESSQAIVEALVSYSDRFPDLQALFLGDIVEEENQMSWINQCDLSALWSAFPRLEHAQIRGAVELSLGRIVSSTLTTLIVESGGLPSRVVGEALAAETPELRHLELWLGSESYGSDSTPDHFEELFAGDLFPKLRTLALRNCDYADSLAAAMAEAPVLARIDTLDLSLGNLTDEGAAALLRSPGVRRLSRLDLHHHFLGDETMARFEGLGPTVDLSGQREEDRYGDEIYRNIAVSE